MNKESQSLISPLISVLYTLIFKSEDKGQVLPKIEDKSRKKKKEKKKREMSLQPEIPNSDMKLGDSSCRGVCTAPVLHNLR